MLNLFLEFIKITLSTFGGGSVMISLMQKEFVETGVIASSEFAKIIALGQATPGPVATGVATILGYKLFGIPGIIIVNIAIALPTLIIIVLFSRFLKRYKDSPYINNIFAILRPIALALIFSVLIFFIKISAYSNVTFNSIYNILNVNIKVILIILIGMLVSIKYKLNPIYIIIFSGVAGAILL